MKTLAKKVPIQLFGTAYTCDVLLGMYENGLRPSIILVTSPEEGNDNATMSEPFAIASTNPPPEYIQHLPANCFAGKTYSENQGIWEQLLTLTDENESLPLFAATKWKITLGFVTAPIYQLGPHATELYEQLRAELLAARQSNRNTLSEY